MLTRILVPLDGSDLAGRVLDRFRPMLARPDVEVVLVTVTDAPNDARRLLKTVQARLVQSGIRTSVRVRSGDAAAAILRVSEEVRPAIIAMATHGRSGPARWVMGSVAGRVLRGARHPVLLSNPADGAGEWRIRRILVPLDGSELSAHIVPFVGSIAREQGAEVILVHSLATTRAGNGAGRGGRATVSVPDGADPLTPHAQRLERAGVRVSARIERADRPAEAIIRAARREAADLVAMTTHGRTGVQRWLMGSVAEKVVGHCPCPVLVLPTRPARVRGRRAGARRRG